MKNFNKRLRNPDTGDFNGPIRYYHSPLWQVGAYWFKPEEGENGCIIGAELTNNTALGGMDIETVPSATWAVFKIRTEPGGKESE